jgi:hypothetical protein
MLAFCKLPAIVAMATTAAAYATIVSPQANLDRHTMNVASNDQPLPTSTLVIPQAKAAAEYAASALNMVAASASLAGAICVTIHSSSCSTLAFVLSGATWTMSGVATQTAIELGDPDFPKIATPEGAAVDTSHLSASTKPMVSALLKAITLANALDQSARRLVAAANGDREWVEIQSRSVARLRDDLGASLTELRAAVVTYSSDLAPAGVMGLTGPGDRLKEIGAALAAKRDQAELYFEAQKVEFALSCLEPSSASIVGGLHRELCRAAVRSFVR